MTVFLVLAAVEAVNIGVIWLSNKAPPPDEPKQ